jgi:hypothetical protein
MVLTRTLLREHNPNYELLATGSSLGYESLLTRIWRTRGLFSFLLSLKTDKRVSFRWREVVTPTTRTRLIKEETSCWF